MLRILGWKAFHQQLIVVLQAFSNRSMSTSEFLEKMNEMEAVEADGRDLKASTCRSTCPDYPTVAWKDGGMM